MKLSKVWFKIENFLFRFRGWSSRSKISKFIPKIVVFEIYRICILNKMLSNSVPKCGIAFVQAFNDEKGNLVGRLM